MYPFFIFCSISKRASAILSTDIKLGFFGSALGVDGLGAGVGQKDGAGDGDGVGEGVGEGVAVGVCSSVDDSVADDCVEVG